MKDSNLICNKLINPGDLETPEWRNVIDEMHNLMKVSKAKRKGKTFEHCTDRRGIIYRAEIASFKHWEYPWAIFWGAFEPGLKVLDCGCGRGFLQIYLALKGLVVSSVDLSSMKAKVVRKFWNLVSIIGLPIKENKISAMKSLAQGYKTILDFQVANLTELPFKDKSFDRVCCISVLEHMGAEEVEKGIKEMSRVLKPAGRLLITVDFSPQPVSGKSFSESDIHKLVDLSGLKILGNYDYSFTDWTEYLNNLRKVFKEPEIEVSSASFILVKE